MKGQGNRSNEQEDQEGNGKQKLDGKRMIIRESPFFWKRLGDNFIVVCQNLTSEMSLLKTYIGRN